MTITSGATESAEYTVYAQTPSGTRLSSFRIESSTVTFLKTFSGSVTAPGLCTGCSVIPRTDDTYDLGYVSGAYNLRWNDIFATNGTIQTSDRQSKTDITPLSNEYSKLFDKLQPVTFKFNNGHRKHTGFIAQDVEQALNDCEINSEDFACLIKSTDEAGNSSYGLRYTEIIALLVKEVQELKAEVKALKGGTE